MVKDQLEKSGLFKVDLQSTEWVTYTKDRVKRRLPGVPAGLVPGLLGRGQLPDAVLPKDNFLKNHYDNPEVETLIAKQPSRRTRPSANKLIEEIQNAVAKDLSTLPLLQGAQVAVAGNGREGCGPHLDASFKFRLGVLSK